jgi:hypothetical protein
VSLHGIIAATAKIFLHALAGFTIIGERQYSFSYGKLSTGKGQQIDACYHNVASCQQRIKAIYPKQVRNGVEMLCLYERDLPLAATAAVMVAAKPLLYG